MNNWHSSPPVKYGLPISSPHWLGDQSECEDGARNAPSEHPVAIMVSNSIVVVQLSATQPGLRPNFSSIRPKIATRASTRWGLMQVKGTPNVANPEGWLEGCSSCLTLIQVSSVATLSLSR